MTVLESTGQGPGDGRADPDPRSLTPGPRSGRFHGGGDEVSVDPCALGSDVNPSSQKSSGRLPLAARQSTSTAFGYRFTPSASAALFGPSHWRGTFKFTKTTRRTFPSNPIIVITDSRYLAEQPEYLFSLIRHRGL